MQSVDTDALNGARRDHRGHAERHAEGCVVIWFGTRGQLPHQRAGEGIARARGIGLLRHGARGNRNGRGAVAVKRRAAGAVLYHHQ